MMLITIPALFQCSNVSNTGAKWAKLPSLRQQLLHAVELKSLSTTSINMVAAMSLPQNPPATNVMKTCFKMCLP